jgi:hypothetical protein
MLLISKDENWNHQINLKKVYNVNLRKIMSNYLGCDTRSMIDGETEDLHVFFLLLGWDFWYCGHYWPIVPAPDDS